MAEKKYDNNGAMAVWERVRKSDGEIFYSGNVEIDGVMYDVVMNVNETDNPKAPAFRGRITVKKEG